MLGNSIHRFHYLWELLHVCPDFFPNYLRLLFSLYSQCNTCVTLSNQINFQTTPWLFANEVKTLLENIGLLEQSHEHLFDFFVSDPSARQRLFILPWYDWLKLKLSVLVLPAVTPYFKILVFKNRIMQQGVRTGGAGVLYSSTLDCFWKTLRSEGPRGLYKGFIPVWMRIGPHTVITFFFYEQFRRALRIKPVWMSSTAIGKNLELTIFLKIVRESFYPCKVVCK